jgi:uncharacterized membrane protein
MTFSRLALTFREHANMALRAQRLTTAENSRIDYVLLAATVVVFVGARFWNLTRYSISGGEAFSIVGARLSWADMFDYLIYDVVHPPLFGVLLKIWITAGDESLLWLKLLPVLFSVATLVPFLLLSRELNLRIGETTLALAFMAVNGYLIHYSQELRMYILLLFFAVCSYWLFARFINARPGAASRKALLALFVANLLLVYTHYFGWLVVGVEGLFLSFWRRQKLIPFSLSVLILIVLFSPWIYLVAQAAAAKGGLDQNLDWIPRPSRYMLKYLYFNFNGNLGSEICGNLSVLLFALPVITWAVQIPIRRRQEQGGDSIFFWWLSFLAFVPVGLVFIVSRFAFFAQAFWMDRYFLFTVIPYTLLVSLSVFRLRPRALRILAILVLVSWSLISGVKDMQTNRLAWESPQVGTRLPWDTMAWQLSGAESTIAGPVNVYVLPVISKDLRTGDYAIIEALNYHLADLNDDRFEMVYKRDLAALDEVQEDHFWVAFFELGDRHRRESLEGWLTSNGYRADDEIQEVQGDNRVILVRVRRTD